MKIEIDTKSDSVNDIKKTIDFLLKFVDEGNRQTEELPTLNEGTFNIFDNPIQEDENKDDESPDVTVVEY